MTTETPLALKGTKGAISPFALGRFGGSIGLATRSLASGLHLTLVNIARPLAPAMRSRSTATGLPSTYTYEMLSFMASDVVEGTIFSTDSQIM